MPVSFSRVMRRSLIVGALALSVLAGCGTSPVSKPNGGGEWYTLTDPVTGVELRCHVIKNRTYNGYDVYTESCYRP